MCHSKSTLTLRQARATLRFSVILEAQLPLLPRMLLLLSQYFAMKTRPLLLSSNCQQSTGDRGQKASTDTRTRRTLPSEQMMRRTSLLRDTPSPRQEPDPRLGSSRRRGTSSQFRWMSRRRSWMRMRDVRSRKCRMRCSSLRLARM